MTETHDNSALRMLLDGVVRLAAAKTFTWASGEEQASKQAFVDRLRQTILDKLEGHPAVEALTVTIDDTRLGYESGGSYTRVRVTLDGETVFCEKILLDEAAHKLKRLIDEQPMRRFGEGAA